MSLNIKNYEAHRLATELAQARRTSVTAAVTEALRNELNRERRRQDRAALARELVDIGRRCAAHITGPLTSQDHAEMLYDDQGLPK